MPKELQICRVLKNGVIAQLARVFDWQSEGQGFESP